MAGSRDVTPAIGTVTLPMDLSRLRDIADEMVMELLIARLANLSRSAR